MGLLGVFEWGFEKGGGKGMVGGIGGDDRDGEGRFGVV